MLKRLTLLGLLLLCATSAKAAILVSLAGSPTANGTGTFDWIYDVRLQPSALLKPGGFFTLYDISGLTGLSNASWNPDNALTGVQTWGVTSANIGPTPVFLAPVDNISLPNVTVSLLNGDNITPDTNGPALTLGQLTLQSAFSAQAPVNFTGQSVQQGQLSPLYNVGPTTAPIPEPSTVGLMGFGLLAVAVVAMRRRSVGGFSRRA